jgi:hypothetical protein
MLKDAYKNHKATTVSLNHPCGRLDENPDQQSTSEGPTELGPEVGMNGQYSFIFSIFTRPTTIFIFIIYIYILFYYYIILLSYHYCLFLFIITHVFIIYDEAWNDSLAAV